MIWRRVDKLLLVLAPMAGYTDSAFRELCRGFGADIVMTELISVDAIYHNKRIRNKELGIREIVDSDKTLQMLKFSEKERPIVVQLFGKYPEKFAYAARWVAENLEPDGIDINMGCPARKVVGSDHGAALLKNPKLAIEIVKAVRENIKLPLSVKTRLGWENDDEILEFAPKLVEAGADALIIHGRTYKDGFKKKARWENIYKVKSEIRMSKSETNSKSEIQNSKHIKQGKRYVVGGKRSTAIIGNGDIASYEDAIEKAESGGIKLDGVAIGRKSFGNPMIFSKIQDTRDKKQTIKEVILHHAKLSYERKGDHGIIEFRKHLVAYLRGQENASELRKQAVEIVSVGDVEKVVSQIYINTKPECRNPCPQMLRIKRCRRTKQILNLK